MGRPKLSKKNRRASVTISVSRELLAKAKASSNASRFFEEAGRFYQENARLDLSPPKDRAMTIEEVVVEFMNGDWKLAAGEIIRHVRYHKNFLGMMTPPVGEFKRLALLASIIVTLADELEISPPGWATSTFKLDEPWFLSGLESMRATALIESPPYFRRNGIFITKEFLIRV